MKVATVKFGGSKEVGDTELVVPWENVFLLWSRKIARRVFSSV